MTVLSVPAVSRRQRLDDPALGEGRRRHPGGGLGEHRLGGVDLLDDVAEPVPGGVELPRADLVLDEPEREAQRDQVVLGAVVQVALDRPALAVHLGHRGPPGGRDLLPRAPPPPAAGARARSRRGGPGARRRGCPRRPRAAAGARCRPRRASPSTASTPTSSSRCRIGKTTDASASPASSRRHRNTRSRRPGRCAVSWTVRAPRCRPIASGRRSSSVPGAAVRVSSAISSRTRYGVGRRPCSRRSTSRSARADTAR